MTTNLRTLDEIRAAGAAVVADWPPLTDEEIAELAFLIAPTIHATPAPADAPERQLSAAA